MRYLVSMEKKRYLYELREQLGSFTDFFSERFTGVVWGGFIYITHHAGFEWNRKITNEKSRAIGFVTKHGDGCAINVIFTRGFLDPWWMGIFYLLFLVLFWIKGADTMGSDVYWLSAVCSAVFCLVSYVQCWFTERGRDSMYELYWLLRNPSRFWVTTEDE